MPRSRALDSWKGMGPRCCSRRRALRRGAPGPCRGPSPARTSRSLPIGRDRLGLALAARPGNAPLGRLPRPLRSRRRRIANGWIRSLAHGRDHSAVSRPSGSRARPSDAPSGSPPKPVRSPARRAGKIWIPLHGIILPPRRVGGAPLATARSRHAMSRSLRLALIEKSFG